MKRFRQGLSQEDDRDGWLARPWNYFEEQFKAGHIRQVDVGDNAIDFPRPVESNADHPELPGPYNTIGDSQSNPLRIVRAVLVVVINQQNGERFGVDLSARLSRRSFMGTASHKDLHIRPEQQY